MSSVTNVLISYSGFSDMRRMAEIHEWLVNECEYGPTRLDCLTEGGKAMEATVYGGGFNYLDVQSFLEFARSLSWDSPENVQIFIQKQHDDIFTVYTVPE